MITLTVSEHQNAILRQLIEERAGSYKNWIVSAVEAGDFEKAQSLTKELRDLQALFHVILPADMLKRYSAKPETLTNADWEAAT